MRPQITNIPTTFSVLPNCQVFMRMYNRGSPILENAVQTALRNSIGLLSMREVTCWRW